MSSILLYSVAADGSVAILVAPIISKYQRIDSQNICTGKTMVEVGDRGVRESDPDLEKCFSSCFSTETRRLCAGVAHSHRDVCRVSPGLWQSREVDG